MQIKDNAIFCFLKQLLIEGAMLVREIPAVKYALMCFKANVSFHFIMALHQSTKISCKHQYISL